MTASPSESTTAVVEHELAAAEHLLAQHKLTHMPHPHLARRRAAGPVKTADHLPSGSLAARFNTWLGVKITSGVGTMQCAYAFAALALISLPEAIKGGSSTMVSWTAQTFLQLVLLSIIMVGQNVQTAAGDARAKATYDDGEAILHYADAHSRRLAELHAKLDDGLAHVHDKLDDNLDAMHRRLDQVAALAAQAATAASAPAPAAPTASEPAPPAPATPPTGPGPAAVPPPVTGPAEPAAAPPAADGPAPAATP